ncbi:MAG: methylated-DNA--[Firmicutes bacterium]|nr:methylated-DNA--[protein]-cysteine S-methyltransferase [Bacillota bacterium]
MLYKTCYDSPLGPITMASDGDNLIGLFLEGQVHFEKTIKEEVITCDDLSIFVFTKNWLDKYFAGEVMEICDLPLRLDGSPFRKAVWHILSKIPYGQLVTYGDIAKEMASLTGKEHMSAQAIGNAVGHNPISIIVPCHRVIGTGGKLTGYAGGIDLKIKLLELEGHTINIDNSKVIL